MWWLLQLYRLNTNLSCFEPTYQAKWKVNLLRWQYWTNHSNSRKNQLNPILPQLHHSHRLYHFPSFRFCFLLSQVRSNPTTATARQLIPYKLKSPFIFIDDRSPKQPLPQTQPIQNSPVLTIRAPAHPPIPSRSPAPHLQVAPEVAQQQDPREQLDL